MKKALLLFFVFLFSSLQPALSAFASSTINGVRMWASPDNTRLVIDLSKAVEHRLSTLSKPERVVVDIDDVKMKKPIKGLNYNSGFISGIRSGKKQHNQLRLVLDLKRKVHPKSFLLKPNAKYGYRLVIDLNKVESSVNKPPRIVKSMNVSQKRDLIVAIDAGHGGEDPGAIGNKGTQEKVVVLKIARKLSQLINRQKGMKAVMIRNGDYYISLRQRTKKARDVDADMFISIHADAFKNARAKGSSVFILSSRGASSEAARWLAKKENDADLIGGVSLDDKDDMLAKLLLDLSQTATIEASDSVAKRVLDGLKKVGKTHKNQVERAGFVVLKSPDMPSILVETGFISNPQEENRLRTAGYQGKLAKAILNGVIGYFKQYPPPGTIYAKDTVIKPLKVASAKLKGDNNTIRHKVSRGDTLSALAKKYQVSVRAIKKANQLKNNTLYIGKVLTIPQS